MHEHLASNLLVPEVAPHPVQLHRPAYSAVHPAFSGNRPVLPHPTDSGAAGVLERAQSHARDERPAGQPVDDAFDVRARLLHRRYPRGAVRLQELGGNTLVDVTTVGIGRDPILIRDFARRSGVHVVMATGWYRWMFHPPEVARRSVEDLAGIMEQDMTTGVGSTGIRAGIIGEIPLDAPGLRLDAPLDSAASGPQ